MPEIEGIEQSMGNPPVGPELGTTANRETGLRGPEAETEESNLKIRTLVIAAAAAGMAAVPAVGAIAAPGTGTGTCVTSTNPSPPAGTDTQAALPDGGTAYAGGTAPTGHVGAQGPHGYIVASGGSSGGTISGYSTDQGNLNGSTTVGSSPSVCAGVNGTTVHS